MENEKLQEALDILYFFLRDEGFSIHSNAIKKMLVHLKNEDLKKLKKEMKSAIISGGAGSMRDIDFRDDEKRFLFNNMLQAIDDLLKGI